ncbi:MAG: RsmD family RNA methyltransferase [Anaerolineae bacterium]|nr:RsmD family RNA methyltransferase [Candidatus Roseilinea sp.]MDW8449937.1 RsmD family RNA methyltransferase [Anaerolineae bacterium]
MPLGFIVLSHYQARPLLEARRAGQSIARTSLDLNRSHCDVTLDAGGITLPDGRRIAWPIIEQIAASESGCYRIGDGAEKIQTYSQATGRTYSLYPTPLAPTMLISGLPMHRIKDTDPYRDTLAKIKAASLTRGRVLDTCTGLGYTAIEAAKIADEVITIELDPAAQEIAQLNPWSQPLFDEPKITRIIGDSYDEVRRFADAHFSRVIHDPPAFALAGELYSADFYAELFRVLKPGGRLFHYIGDLDSASGSRTARGVVERLKRAGFQQVTPRPEAFGVVAHK